MPICNGEVAKLVAMEARPMPMKKTAIMALRFHLSARCAARGAPAPNRISDGTP